VTPSESSSVRVIHLPEIVGGNAGGISHGLRKIGVNSETLAISAHRFGYPADKFILSGGESLARIQLKKILALRNVLEADVVFFNFGKTLFSPITSTDVTSLNARSMRGFLRLFNFYLSFAQLLELSLLRAKKKIIFVQYQGDDARQSDFFEKNYQTDYANLSGQTVDAKYFNRLKRKQISRVAKYANRIYALNPDLLRVLPAGSEFLPYCHIDLESWKPLQFKSEGPIVFGHAPSHQGIKGTSLILEAFSKLRQQGHNLELILIENLPNSEARKLYERVDVMIDQLHIGWYGGLAVEVMALAKPVACFIRESDLALIPSSMASALPILRITKEALMEDILRISQMDRESLGEIGLECRRYVDKFHDPNQIAYRIFEDIQSSTRVTKRVGDFRP
jgi:glycosyltransferase involved in cell wall biosynthesis